MPVIAARFLAGALALGLTTAAPFAITKPSANSKWPLGSAQTVSLTFNAGENDAAGQPVPADATVALILVVGAQRIDTISTSVAASVGEVTYTVIGTAQPSTTPYYQVQLIYPASALNDGAAVRGMATSAPFAVIAGSSPSSQTTKCCLGPASAVVRDSAVPPINIAAGAKCSNFTGDGTNGKYTKDVKYYDFFPASLDCSVTTQFGGKNIVCCSGDNCNCPATPAASDASVSSPTLWGVFAATGALAAAAYL